MSSDSPTLAVPEAVPALAPAVPIPAAKPSSPPAAEASAHVLVVEDDPRSARMLTAWLTASSHPVRVVGSAEEAQEALQEQLPDLIICDVCLPGMNGVELTRWLRGNESMKNIPVLIVTSFDDRKILSRSLDAGADDFLTKPLNTLELRTRVRSLLRTKSLADELHAREAAASPFQVPQATLEPAAVDEAAPPPAAPLPASSTILLVDDDVQECRLIEAFLQQSAVRLHVVHTAQDALDYLERQRPDLVILDLVLPEMNGYNVIEQMRGTKRHAQTPILVVSALSEVSDRVKALELGADDFILKGSDRAEMQARARRLLRLKQSLDQLSERCDSALKQAVTDGLTGLYTHGFLKDTLQRQAACARRYNWPLSLLFIDIDHFKQINDRYGHAVGDEVLRRLASELARSVRDGDTAVRYGGEEFVVLLPHTSRDAAHKLAERIRTSVESLTVQPEHLDVQDRLRLTVSIGVAALPEDAADAAALLHCADEAMYRAKRAGRNQVNVFGSAQAPTARGRILLVDDDERNLRVLEAFLLQEGYELLKGRDGAEAIDIARRERPDLILMDGMMPHVSGFDACRRLKNETATKLIPIVIITALNGREDRLRGIEAGADDFLTKPIDRAELLARIRALLKAKRSTDSLEDAETVIVALARAVESRDPSTGGHVERVSHYAVTLGQALGMGPTEIDALRRAGFVHDIGKIAIPDSILLKPGALTPEERKIMQSHVEVGYQMLQPMRTFRECLPAVRFHHERLDGSGYPLGLRGEQVPLMAQVMAIVDVFDALTTHRVYRGAMTYSQALETLADEAARGLHDPALLEKFAEIIQVGHLTPS